MEVSEQLTGFELEDLMSWTVSTLRRPFREDFSLKKSGIIAEKGSQILGCRFVVWRTAIRCWRISTALCWLEFGANTAFNSVEAKRLPAYHAHGMPGAFARNLQVYDAAQVRTRTGSVPCPGHARCPPRRESPLRSPNLTRRCSELHPTSSCESRADPHRCRGYTGDAPPAYPASSGPGRRRDCPAGADGEPCR